MKAAKVQIDLLDVPVAHDACVERLELDRNRVDVPAIRAVLAQMHYAPALPTHDHANEEGEDEHDRGVGEAVGKAVGEDEGSTLVVIGNALRLLTNIGPKA